MYDRADRFKKLTSKTPNKVGPATYFLSGSNSSTVYNSVPFNSTEKREFCKVNKNNADDPSPGTYNVRFRKKRIVGGTSMQNRAPRFKHKLLHSQRGPYNSKGAKFLPGKLYKGIPPRSKDEKGVLGYEITDEGIVTNVEVYQEENGSNRSYYYNPEQFDKVTSTYKGNGWSLRTDKRFHQKRSEGPGPADYITAASSFSSITKQQDIMRQLIQARSPLLRHNDLLQLKLCRENLPGPANYSPVDPNSRKCGAGKFGTFSTSQRQAKTIHSDSPGPAHYDDHRTALESMKLVSYKELPFNVTSRRFSEPNNTSVPGPSDYSPTVGLWNDVQKKAHSRFAGWNAPFDSSAVRETSFVARDAACIPGPDMYYPQAEKKGDDNKSRMFAGCPGELKKNVQASPGPAAYSITDAFKAVHNCKSHLRTNHSAFLTSSNRLDDKESVGPAPNAYLLESTLATRGCVVGHKLESADRHVTPGPADYSVHPKSDVFHSFNVTLTPEKARACKRGTFTKRLRCFSTNQYETGHCPTYNCVY